jgi:alpha-mannosidase
MKRIFSRIIFLLLTILVNNISKGQSVSNAVVNDTTYMLTYDHGGLILWGSDHFRERLQNAIEWLDKYKSFKIGLDNEAYVYDYFAENEPEILGELNEYLIKYKGRFGIGSSTYGQPLSQFINDESNIRQFSYAIEAEIKYLNYRPPVYLMSEHAMHSQIPQILNGFGYKGAIMRTHFMMYGYNPTFDLPIGKWKGFDGSEIPTIPTYIGEGAAFGKTTIDTWILTRYPSKDSPEPMESFREKFKNINPLLASRADDSGLRKEELVKEYDKKPKFSWILLDELLSKYLAPTKLMITKPNDFIVRMPWGYCGNEIWNSSRKAENSVLVAERLAAIEMMNKGESHEKSLDIAWKNLLLAQHHDIQICGLLPDAGRLLPKSIENSEQTIKASMEFFAKNMSGEGVKQITVFNPLSWKQTKWIETDIDISGGKAKSYIAKCGEIEVPVNIISPNILTDGNNIEVKGTFKVDLDPLSINSYSIIGVEKNPVNEKSGIKSDDGNLVINTPYYEITLSKDGGINSIKDVMTNKLIAGQKSRSAFFEGTIEGKDYQSSGKWIIQKSKESTPWIKMIEHGFISDIPYVFEMTLFEDNPRIDCRVKFDFNGQKIGLLSDNKRDSHSPFVHEEKLRFKIFPNIDTASVGIRDLPFAIAETNNKYIEGNYWTALSDGSSGFAFFNKGNMGSVKEKDNGFSIPLAYSMYYIWGTRILYGSYDYEFALLPFQGDWKSADLHRKALEYNMPLPVIESSPNKGKLGQRISPVTLNGDKELLLTALYPKTGKIVARFFRADDVKSVSSLDLKVNGASISETRLDGQYIKEVAGKVSFKPWEIMTFQIE